MGREAGLTTDDLEALPDYSRSDAFPAADRAALALADAMTSTPATVPDELYAELSGHFSPEQLVELASAIAWEHYRARFNRAFEVESEDFSAGAYCPLPLR